MTIFVKAKITKTQQNSKCRFCGDRNETINHIKANKCKKSISLVPTGWEKWSTRNNAENLNLSLWKSRNLSWRIWCTNFFGIWKTNVSRKLGKTTRSSAKKYKPCWIVGVVVPADHRVKLKESEKRGKYLDLIRELKNMEHKVECDTRNWVLGQLGTWDNHQKFGNGTENLGNQMTNGDNFQHY